MLDHNELLNIKLGITFVARVRRCVERLLILDITVCPFRSYEFILEGSFGFCLSEVKEYLLGARQGCEDIRRWDIITVVIISEFKSIQLIQATRIQEAPLTASISLSRQANESGPLLSAPPIRERGSLFLLFIPLLPFSLRHCANFC